MTDIKSLDLQEITQLLREMGEPSFRGKQVFTWLHRGVTSFEEMSDLSKPLRQKLAERCYITVPTVERKQVSKHDGTVKYLWRLPDGNCIETVLMRYHHGNTVCISSQVGCRMGCKFCASTLGGLVRRLRPSELLDQVLYEVVSAFGTVGLSTGITPNLNTISKLLIIFTMFVGRVGPLTVSMALSGGPGKPDAIHFPEDRLMVG